MYCKECERHFKSGVIFCDKCGRKLEQENELVKKEKVNYKFEFKENKKPLAFILAIIALGASLTLSFIAYYGQVIGIILALISIVFVVKDKKDNTNEFYVKVLIFNIISLVLNILILILLFIDLSNNTPNNPIYLYLLQCN